MSMAIFGQPARASANRVLPDKTFETRVAKINYVLRWEEAIQLAMESEDAAIAKKHSHAVIYHEE